MRRTEEQDVIAALHVATGSEFPDLLGIDRRLELEVEALHALLEGKARHHDEHLMMLLGRRRRPTTPAQRNSTPTSPAHIGKRSCRG